MARLVTTFSDVYTIVSETLGLGSSPTGDDLTKVKNIVYRAYKRFLYPTDARTGKRHTWSFLQRTYELTTTGDDYTYDLPADFQRMLLEPTYSSDSLYGPLTNVAQAEISNLNAISTTSSYPVKYAIVPKDVDPNASEELAWEIWLWPIPDGAYTINFLYQIEPDKPTEAGDYFYGGPEAGEVITELSLAVAEQQEDDMSTTHHSQIAEKLLQDMIMGDDINTPGFFGKMLRKNQLTIYRGFNSFTAADIYADDA